MLADNTNKFKTPQGVLLSRALFFETVTDKSCVLFTLKNEDYKGYPSLYRLFMETGDLTEHKFGKMYFDSFDHWEDITKSTWFQPYITKWRHELQTRTASEALSNIIAMSKQPDNKNSFAANKFLLEWGRTAKAGRPTKEAIREAAEKHFTETHQLQDDAKRLNLN